MDRLHSSDAQVPEKVMDWSEISQILPIQYPATVFCGSENQGIGYS